MFTFIGVRDCGETCCPHCGATGRYIYEWIDENGSHSAMAGCYAMLTGKLKKDDVQKHIERLSVKQAKNKPLNGWDKTIIRMLDYIKANNNDASKCAWAHKKIRIAVSECKAYCARRF